MQDKICGATRGDVAVDGSGEGATLKPKPKARSNRGPLRTFSYWDMRSSGEAYAEFCDFNTACSVSKREQSKSERRIRKKKERGNTLQSVMSLVSTPRRRCPSRHRCPSPLGNTKTIRIPSLGT